MEGRLGSLSAGVLRTRSFSHPSAFLFFFFFNSPPAVPGGCHLGCSGSEWFLFSPGVGDAAVCPEGGGFPSSHARPSLDL